jgi:ubiquinol-cytochrome c reductase cytochrome b subunit
MFTALYRWLESRLGLREAVLPMLTHPVPRGAAEGPGWWYVFGSATLALFIVQVLTGIALALVYVPSADQAYDSLLYLNYEQPFGWLLRALHNCAASGMVVMMFVHMAQVFLHGAFKYPRELTWLAGVGLLILTLALAATGQCLRWDSDGVWTMGVSAAMAGRVPWIGPDIVQVLLGGPSIGGATLSRFFAMHVFVLPALLMAVLVVHLYLVIRKGISEPPQPGKLVDPKTYDEEYEQELRQGKPFFPDAMARDAIFVGLVLTAVVVIACIVGPEGPSQPPDPTLIQVNPRPDWYFLPLFGLLSLSPQSMETPIILALPPLLILALVLVPFVFNKGERAPSRRPVAVLVVAVTAITAGALGYLGYKSPWSPNMTAWSGAPVPKVYIEQRSPLELQGAAVLQNKNCRNCHALAGEGGFRGPQLDGVGVRLTRDDLIRQVIQGGGEMPAYGKQLKPAEVTALVAFLQTLRPAGVPEAKTPVVASQEP